MSSTAEPEDALVQTSHATDHDGHDGDGEVLGPVDWRAWGAAVLGLAVALAVAVVLVVGA